MKIEYQVQLTNLKRRRTESALNIQLSYSSKMTNKNFLSPIIFKKINILGKSSFWRKESKMRSGQILLKLISLCPFSIRTRANMALKPRTRYGPACIPLIQTQPSCWYHMDIQCGLMTRSYFPTARLFYAQDHPRSNTIFLKMASAQ